jgi:hypothetical protein
VCVCTGFSWHRTGVGSYEHANELPGSIKGGEFIDELSDY